MASLVRIAIAGAGGKMGQAVIDAALSDSALAIGAAFDVPGSLVVGRDAGERFGRKVGVVIGTDAEAAIKASDVLVDFTRPAGTLAHLAHCARHGAGAVIGTTGFSDEDKIELARYGREIALVVAPNMSVGVNVLLSLVETATRRLGPAYDIEIVEMHHRHKVDAPSGTALALGDAAARGADLDRAASSVYAREGVTGARKSGTIGFATLRGGDVIGEHTVIFAGTGERIELSHKAGSRQNFAAGALRAAHFVAGRRAAGECGLFDMRDVLGLR